MSASSQLPETVQNFVLRYIDSVAELEGLLLLRTEQGPWTVDALAQRLYVDRNTADQVLAAFQRHGMATRAGDLIRYAPQSDALAAAVDALAASYPRLLIPITRFIHSKPRQALRQFAEAFRLREDT